MKPRTAPQAQTAGFMIFSSMMLFLLSTVVLALFLNRLQIAGEGESAPTRRIQDLVSLLKQAEGRRTTLESEISKLRKSVINVQHSSTDSTTDAPNADQPELKKLYTLAGFTSVRGPGLEIRLEESKAAPAANDAHADPNAGKLQADDLLKLVNELKAAGASAISINDQRVIITTEIVAAGNTISINQHRLIQPVTIRAIGDPDVLMSALKIRGGIMEYLDFFGIKVNIKKDLKMKVPGYKGPLPR